MKLRFSTDYEEPTLCLLPDAEPEEEKASIITSEGEISFSNPRQNAFLAAYEQCGIISEACATVGISVSRVYRWQQSPQFADCMRIAKQVAAEKLEGILLDRVVNGVGRKYKFTRDGTPVMWVDPDTGEEGQYYEVVHSDGLMTLAIKAAMPEKYSDRVKHEHEGNIKAYVCFDPTQIGTVSSAEDFEALPSDGQRDSGDAVDRP